MIERINCTKWSECGIKHAGICALGLYGGRPSRGTCSVCKRREPYAQDKPDAREPVPRDPDAQARAEKRRAEFEAKRLAELPAAHKALADIRLEICRGQSAGSRGPCPEYKGHHADRVKCSACGCGSYITSTPANDCPRQHWPKP